MSAFAFASLLIAVFAAAGAVPLLRGLLRSSLPEAAVGGAAMLVAMAVASFYMDPWPSSTNGLVLCAIGLVLAGLRVDAWKDAAAWPKVRRRFEWTGALVAAIVLVAFLDNGRVTWSFGFIMLLAVALCAPLATSSLARARYATPALPTGVVLVEILMLLLFGLLNAAGGSRYSLYDEFAIVAMPAAGAMIGCLVYLSRMPWRPEAAISVGTAGHLALGLLVAWGALRLGSITAEVLGGTTALLWLISVPTFELVRGWLGRQAGRLADTAWASHPNRRWLARTLRAIPTGGYPPVVLTVIALAMGAVGIGLCVLAVSGYWMTLGLAAAFVAYLVVPSVVVLARPDRPAVLPLASSHRPD